MAQVWRAGWLAAMTTGKRGPLLYYYDCPDQCCYGKGVCNPPDQFASWKTFQDCLDATADPSCRFTTSVLFGLNETEIQIYTNGILLDATLLWKTFPNLFMDPARPMRVSGYTQGDCIEVVPCHEAAYPPTGDCSLSGEDEPDENPPFWNSFDYDAVIDTDGIWLSTNHWVPQRPTLSLLNAKNNQWCTGRYTSPVDAMIPIKVPFKGGDQVPTEVLNNPLPW